MGESEKVASLHRPGRRTERSSCPEMEVALGGDVFPIHGSGARVHFTECLDF